MLFKVVSITQFGVIPPTCPFRRDGSHMLAHSEMLYVPLLASCSFSWATSRELFSRSPCVFIKSCWASMDCDFKINNQQYIYMLYETDRKTSTIWHKLLLWESVHIFMLSFDAKIMSLSSTVCEIINAERSGFLKRHNLIHRPFTNHRKYVVFLLEVLKECKYIKSLNYHILVCP